MQTIHVSLVSVKTISVCVCHFPDNTIHRPRTDWLELTIDADRPIAVFVFHGSMVVVCCLDDISHLIVKCLTPCIPFLHGGFGRLDLDHDEWHIVCHHERLDKVPRLLYMSERSKMNDDTNDKQRHTRKKSDE